MRSYTSHKTTKSDSQKHGTGLFAVESISKGEVIAIKSGDVVTRSEAIAVADEIGDYFFQIHDNFFFSPSTEADLEMNTLHINHSCEPSVGILGSVTFVAMRDIAAGEELSYDIAMTSAHEYGFTCNCEKNNCRKEVSGSDWMLPELQDRYKGYFSSYIQSLIDKSLV